MLSQPFSRRMAAYSWMIVQCRHAALVFFMMQGQMSLTLHWHSCLGHSPDVFTAMFCHERRAIVRVWVKDAAKPSVFSTMQCQKSLTLRWHSFLGSSNDIVCSIFAHTGRQYYHFGQMPLHSPVIIQDVRPEMVDALLTLISMTGQYACGFQFSLLSRAILLLWMNTTMQPGDYKIDMTINRWRSVDAHLWAYLKDLLTVIRCSKIVQKMRIASIGSQYTVSMEYHLNPRSSRNLSFWATTIYVIYMINDVGPSRFNSFCRQFTA